jgi:ABC-type branched-subunit amino acid transport system substrate-binding protein
MSTQVKMQSVLWSIVTFVPWLGAAGRAPAEEFLVGVETPLTGSLARVGTRMSEGIQVAADVFNRKNGKHRFPAARRRCLRWQGD